jgi:hypothetical protein
MLDLIKETLEDDKPDKGEKQNPEKENRYKFIGEHTILVAKKYETQHRKKKKETENNVELVVQVLSFHGFFSQPFIQAHYRTSLGSDTLNLD